MNGEIYNHQELRKEFPDYEFLTQSDCEVILALYRKYGKDFIEKLNGIFAFSLYDIENDIYLIARDTTWEFVRFIKVGTNPETIM